MTARVPTLSETARLFGISPSRRKVLDEMIAKVAGKDKATARRTAAHARKASSARRVSPARTLKKAAPKKSARRARAQAK